MTEPVEIEHPMTDTRPRLPRMTGWLRWQWQRLPERLIALGLSPRAFGWRKIQHITPERHVAECGGPGDYKVIAPRETFDNPLPGNIGTREALDPDAGWWGYAMRDVPARESAATCFATLSDVRVLSYLDGEKRNFTPAILDARNRAIALPQVRFRDGHARIMRSDAPKAMLPDAVWFLERVYDNHSHWLTAHLPKLLLLKRLGLLERTIMPASRTAAMEASLEMIGIDPAAMLQYQTGTVLHVGRLGVPITDRFDPRLLRPVRDAFADGTTGAPSERVFISRARAKGRKILNEDRLWQVLETRGFARVFMEELSFPEQVRLMQRSAVIVAPHGAGLTNMMFCPEGADIIELADPGYPNPNFYALASAMGHRYWLLGAEARGAGHALEKDLTVDIRETLDVIDHVLAQDRPE